MLTSMCRVLRVVGSTRVRTLVTRVHSTTGLMLPKPAASRAGRQMRSSCTAPCSLSVAHISVQNHFYSSTVPGNGAQAPW